MVQEIIETYKNESSSFPDWYVKAEKKVVSYPAFNKCVRKIITIMKQDVCHRFMIVGDQSLPIYNLNKADETLTFTKEHISIIRRNGFVLKQLLNYFYK